MTEKFNQEAEKRYPYPKDSDRIIEEIQDNKRKVLISGCELGYKEGIEKGMRFSEWVTQSIYNFQPHASDNIWSANRLKYATTTELFEIFKKEQDGNK
jgi:hypothetical protein